MDRAHHREAGAGPVVLCIHPSSSSSAQWKPLMARLSSRYRVVAVDIYGHGRSPRWHASRDLTLADEATLIGLLARELPHDPATREIQALRADTDQLVHHSRPEAATQLFLTYWAGAGAWESLPDDRRRNLIAGVDALPHGWAAAFGHGPTLEQLGSILAPCLLLSGADTRTPPAAVVRLQERALPTVTSVTLPGLGHLGPLTDPAAVDAEIEAFLASSAG